MRYRAQVTDHSLQARIFKRRAVVAALLCILAIIGLLVRLGWLQVIEYAHFSDLSENNRVRLMALPPNRGLIYDRKGVVLAENRPTFHLEIIPEEVEDIDALLVELAEIVELRQQDIDQFKKDMRNNRPFESISLRTRLNDDELARLAVNRHRFPGMDISARLSRHYPQGETASHAIGYVGRINEQELQRIDVGNYRGTSHIGKTGLEKYYEEVLHGQVGQQNVEVNAEGRLVNVIDRIPPRPGYDLVLGLDIELQKLAEQALGDLAGAIIAMDARTGDVLVYVSKPTYDPNLFVHGISVKKYNELQHGVDKPLFNRAQYGQYPPGSTYKPFLGLAALETGVMSANKYINCHGYYTLPNDEDHRYRDWKKDGHGPTNLSIAIEQSCDVYFYELSYLLGIDRMHAFLSRFGFGEKTGIDMPGERSGLLPSREWKKRVHRKIWFPGETLIAGIGQGYMLSTPLQLAKATTALANRGTMVSPRMVKELRATDGTVYETRPSVSTEIKLKQARNWNIVDRAMEKVVHGSLGTARATGWKIKFKMAGKTGTAQVFSIGQDEEYDEETVARKLRDHALFIGFAPYKDPDIVVAVIGENGEHGSAVAPIAASIMQRYFEQQAEAEVQASKQ